MDFGQTEERRLLQESLHRFLNDNYDAEKRQHMIESPAGYSQDVWRALANLGIIGALFAERDGGYGGAGYDIITIFEELGRAGALEPLLETAVLCGGLIAELGNEAQKRLLQDIIDGKIQLAFAHSESQSRYDLSYVTAQAEQQGEHYILSGHKTLIANGNSANWLIVSARTSSITSITSITGDAAAAHNKRSAYDQNGISLFLIPADGPGIERRDYPMMAGGHGAEITFQDVKLEKDALLGAPGEAYPAIEKRIAYAITAQSAKCLGAMERAKDLTIDYLQTRKQFGRPLGQFQALQHRMANMLVEIEQARSAVMNCAEHIEKERSTRETYISAAKNLLGRAGRMVAEETIQMHGGIGMTQEYELAHFAKTIMMSDHMFGDMDHHLERFIHLQQQSAHSHPQ